MNKYLELCERYGIKEIKQEYLPQSNNYGFSKVHYLITDEKQSYKVTLNVGFKELEKHIKSTHKEHLILDI